MMKLKSMMSVVFVCILSASVLFAQEVSAPEIVSVSIIDASLLKGERILAFDIIITAGGISSLPKVPIGWGLVVDNNPSWHTSISGNITDGAAALDADYFTDFIQIEKEPSNQSDFDIMVTLKTTTDGNFDNETVVEFGKEDLNIISVR
ncbi:MAG: hypothetical protein HZA22_03220 [Nitrospirae bacterium]|nr:hypothetical protein [Nitrospirota bacterium]